MEQEVFCQRLNLLSLPFHKCLPGNGSTSQCSWKIKLDVLEYCFFFFLYEKKCPSTKVFLEFVPNHLPSYIQEGSLLFYVSGWTQVTHTCEWGGGTKELPGVFMFSPEVCCSKIHFLIRIRHKTYNLLRLPMLQSYCLLKLFSSIT